MPKDTSALTEWMDIQWMQKLLFFEILINLEREKEKKEERIRDAS